MLKPTKQAIDAVKPKPTLARYAVEGGPTGFHLAVTPSGHKTWTLLRRQGGRRLFHKLGTWPAQNAEQARKLAWEMLGKLERNEPLKPEPGAPALTLGDLRREYLAHLERRKAKSLSNVQAGLRYLDPLARVPVGEVAREQVVGLLHPVWAAGKLTYAESLKTWTRAMFNWAIASEAVVGNATGHRWNLTSNPVQGVSIEGYQPTSADIVWTPDEMRTVWARVGSRADPVVALAVRACIAAGGQRVQEILGMRWDDYDQGTITFRNTKMGGNHTIPVGRWLTGVLAEARALTGNGEYVFGLNGTPPLYNSLARAVRRVRPVGSEIAPRYLRATAKTLLAEAGVDRTDLDLYQNHAPLGWSRVASKHYDRSNHLERKARVIAAWDALLDQTL